MKKVAKVDRRPRIIVDPELKWQLKALAVKQKTSLQALVNEILLKYISEDNK